MLPVDPTVFLHPAQYHDGGIAFLPLAVLVVGVGLIAFGAWQVYEAPRRAAQEPVEPSTDASAER